MDRNEDNKGENEKESGYFKDFGVKLESEFEENTEHIKNKVLINEQNFFNTKDVHKSKEKKIVNKNVNNTESNIEERNTMVNSTKCEKVNDEACSKTIESNLNDPNYGKSVVESENNQSKNNKDNNANTSTYETKYTTNKSDDNIVNTEKINHNIIKDHEQTKNSKTQPNQIKKNENDIPTNNTTHVHNKIEYDNKEKLVCKKFDNKARSFETKCDYENKTDDSNSMYAKDDCEIVNNKLQNSSDFTSPSIVLQFKKTSENVEKFDFLNKKLKEKIKISLLKNTKNDNIIGDDNIHKLYRTQTVNKYDTLCINDKNNTMHVNNKNSAHQNLYKINARNSNYQPEKNNATENSQKHIKKSKINKNQISHSVFENNISDYFKEISKQTYDYIVKQNNAKIENEKVSSVSNKEKLISALVDYKDIEIENKKDRCDYRYGEIIENTNEQDNKYINRFFKKYKIDCNEKLETEDEFASLYIKQTEVNNKRKIKLEKLLKEKLQQKACLDALYMIDQSIVKMYYKKIKNKKKYKSNEYPIEIDEMLEKRRNFVRKYAEVLNRCVIDGENIFEDENVNTSEIGYDAKNFFK
ncbi:hypothetical protein BDAP_002614 [Binucleata daphniae]